MSINQSSSGGQLAAEVYKELLNIFKHEMSNHTSPARTCNWRFQPPQRTAKAEAALRAYWGDIFKENLAALDAEWAEPRTATLITQDASTTETANDHITSASKSA